MNIEQDRFLKFLLIGVIQAQVERSGAPVDSVAMHADLGPPLGGSQDARQSISRATMARYRTDRNRFAVRALRGL